MKAKRFLTAILALTILTLFIANVYAHTITVPTNKSFGLPLYGTYINFSSQQTFDVVYRESNFWYFDGYGFQVIGANMTITNYGFAYHTLIYNLTGSGTSTSKIYTYNKGSPTSVSGATFWSYDAPTKILTVTATGSTSITVSWISDTTPPTYSNIGTNTTITNQPCLFHVQCSDNVGLSGFIFSTNNTGTWTNDTWTDPWSGTPTSGWANVTKTLNNTINTRVQFKFFCNDTSNNWAQSELCFFTTSGTEVQIEVYQAYASQTIVYVDTAVTVAFRHRFSNNQSYCTSGASKINNTEYSINSTGWATGIASYSTAGTRVFTVTEVNVNGITAFQIMTSNITVTWIDYPPAVAYVDWYMRSDTHTVNNQTGYKLAETNTVILTSLSFSTGGQQTVYFGYRLWVLRRNSQVVEITSGTPTATIFRSSDGKGMQNSSITIPCTNLQVGFDALKICIYVKFGLSDWQLATSFMTERLVKSGIVEDTYAFSLYTERLSSGGNTYGTIRFGSSSYTSGITLQLQEPTNYQLMQYQLQSGNLVGFVLQPYVSVIGNLFYGLIMLILCVPLYNRYRSLTPIVLLFIIFGGAGGVFSLLIPAASLGLTWIFLLFGLAGLLYKVFR